MKTKKALLCIVLICISFFGVHLTVSAQDNHIVDTSNHTYTFYEMQEDITLLVTQYPEYFQLEIIGTSVDGRNIYGLIIGNPETKNIIYVQAGLYGREWMNCMMLMRQIEECAINWNSSYADSTYGEIFNNCAVYVVPMVNPDGVTISQYGIEGIVNPNLKASLYIMRGAQNPQKWKANANGVDLNRNFSIGFNGRIDHTSPCSESYNGNMPFSEPESVAIANVFNNRTFVAAISYHSYGGAIYWDLGQNDPMRAATCNLAVYVQNITGYKLGEVSPLKGLEYNWMVYEKNVPTIIIETGTVPCPLPYSQWNTLWLQNKDIIVATAYAYRNLP